VIFVHGCFWHRHRCRSGRGTPKTNQDFWAAKFTANKTRDRKTKAALRRLGWRVFTVWECQTKDPGSLEKRVASLLLDDLLLRS
jgi:DNA mismatch endonuclease (patch repair protein)